MEDPVGIRLNNTFAGMPLFSILVTNYNNGKYLAQRLETIQAQTCTDFEVIVLDDASTDNSRAIFDRFRNDARFVAFHYYPTNHGTPFPLWKEGILQATGEWIWVAESDDFTDPQFLHKAKTVIDREPSIGLLYTDAWIVTDEERTGRFSAERKAFLGMDKWKTSYRNNGVSEINEILKYHNTINNPSNTVFKRSLALPHLEALAGQHFYGDWYLFLCICLQADICYLHEPLSTYRYHPGNHSKSAVSLPSKRSYLEIFLLLYHDKRVQDKQKLLRYFADHYLGTNLFQNSQKTLLQIIRHYAQRGGAAGVQMLVTAITTKLLRRQK